MSSINQNPNAPWEMEWTPETISRFWDWYVVRPGFAGRYFSLQRGHSILEQISPYLPSDGPVVELGAGPGHLTHRLMAKGVPTLALDTSVQAVELLNERFGSTPEFLGARASTNVLPVDSGMAAGIVIVETVEHLNANVAASLLGEARRILRPGGRLFITTPNEEDLSAEHVMCPNCACTFHPIQHIRSFSASSLSEQLTSAGFNTLVCRPTYFSQLAGIHAKLESVRRRLERIRPPHLLYIGER